MTQELTNRIIMIRPAAFGFNVETAKDNAFQSKPKHETKEQVMGTALDEFDGMVQLLRKHKVDVWVWDDKPTPVKPDALFPNNWFSTHADGTVITYPMYAENRRIERSEAMLEQLNKYYEIEDRYHMEFYELENKFLEGTGSMVLDRKHKIVYACLSERTHVDILIKFCVLMGYKACYFDAVDVQGTPIYHTNVLMCLGSEFVVICLDAIKSPEEQQKVRAQIEATDKEIINISNAQMNQFAGNMLEVINEDGEPILVMSKSAHDALEEVQLERLSSYAKIVVPDIAQIEHVGGGSVRCMMAENFLKKR